MLKALGLSSSTISFPSRKQLIPSSSFSSASPSSTSPPSSISPASSEQDSTEIGPPRKRAMIVHTPEKATSSLASDLSPNFFSPTLRVPSPQSNAFLPRPPPRTRSDTAAWASSGPDPRILDVRGRMWGLTKDTRHFVPDSGQRDRLARSQAVKSLTSTRPSTSPDETNDSTGRNGGSQGGSSSSGELPWGTYLENKRERERERNSRRAGLSANGGTGWLPFWRSSALGRLASGWGGGTVQLAAISVSAERRASVESAQEARRARDEREFIASFEMPKPKLPSPPPQPSSQQSPSSPSPPPFSFQSAHLASALGLSPPPPPASSSYRIPRTSPFRTSSSPGLPPSTCPLSSSHSRFRPPSLTRSSPPSPPPPPPPPSNLSRPPRSVPLLPPRSPPLLAPRNPFATPLGRASPPPPSPPPSRPPVLVNELTPPLSSLAPISSLKLFQSSKSKADEIATRPAEELSPFVASPTPQDLVPVLDVSYAIDPSYESVYRNWDPERRYPSVDAEEEGASSEEDARRKASAWSESLLALVSTGIQDRPDGCNSYSVPPLIPFGQILETPDLARPPHPFTFIIPSNPAADQVPNPTEGPDATAISLEVAHPPTLRLLQLAVFSFARLGFTREAVSILEKSWPGWSAGSPHHSSSSTPPPLSIYVSIITSFLHNGQWEDALAWIETVVVRARHPLSMPTYYAFFRSFEWSTDTSNTEALLERLQADESQLLRYEHFARIVYRSLMRSGGVRGQAQGLAAARHWFARMDAAGLRPGMTELTILMDAATEADDRVLTQKIWNVVQAKAKFQSSPNVKRKDREPSVIPEVFASYLRSLRANHVGWINVASVISEAISSGSLVPNYAIYSAAIRSAVDDGYVRQAIEMLEFMENVGVDGRTFKAEAGIFTIILAGILRRQMITPGQIKSSQSAHLGEVSRPWRTETAGDGSGFKLPPRDVMEQTLAILQEMKKRGLAVTSSIHFAIIEYVGSLPTSSDLAIRLANQLVKNLPKPGEDYTEKNAWAAPSLSHPVQPEEMILRLLVKLHGVSGNVNMVEAISADLLDRVGEAVNLKTVEILLLAARRVGSEGLVRQLWEVALATAVRDTDEVAYETETTSPTEPLASSLPASSASDCDNTLFTRELFCQMSRPPSIPSSTSSPPSTTERFVPPNKAHLLNKSTYLLLLTFLDRGEITSNELTFLIEQWRRVGALGFGFDARCWDALMRLYLLVEQPEKALQIANDIVCWRWETLTRKFEASVGRTIKGEEVDEGRTASEESWIEELARGEDGLPEDLKDAPEDFKKVIRTSFDMLPTPFATKGIAATAREAFSWAFPPSAELISHPFVPYTSPADFEPDLSLPPSPSPSDNDEDPPDPRPDNGRHLPPHLQLSHTLPPSDYTPSAHGPATSIETEADAIDPRTLSPHQLSHLTARVPRAPLSEVRTPLVTPSGLQPVHIELHPASVTSWKLLTRTAIQFEALLDEMKLDAKEYALSVAEGMAQEETEEENLIEKHQRFERRYARALRFAREDAAYARRKEELYQQGRRARYSGLGM